MLGSSNRELVSALIMFNIIFIIGVAIVIRRSTVQLIPLGCSILVSGGILAVVNEDNFPTYMVEIGQIISLIGILGIFCSALINRELR